MSEVCPRIALARHRQRSRCRHAHASRPTSPCPRRRAHSHTRARTHDIAPVQSISITRPMATPPPLTTHHHHSSTSTGWRYTVRALTSFIIAATLTTCNALAPQLRHLHMHGTAAHAVRHTRPSVPLGRGCESAHRRHLSLSHCGMGVGTYVLYMVGMTNLHRFCRIGAGCDQSVRKLWGVPLICKVHFEVGYPQSELIFGGYPQSVQNFGGIPPI